MANSNVRFYRLDELPSFVVAKHKGIFVHVTKTMGNKKWALDNNPSFNPEKILITHIKNINLEQWLSNRRIESIESGLWFGGENGWELLSNDINSIDAKIKDLDVDGYAQATISDSTLTIFGIKEVDGRIVKDEDNGKKLEVAIDGTYDKTNNKIATQLTVTNAINNLDVQTPIQAVTFNTPENGGNTTLTFKGVKEENGKIVDGNGTGTFIVGDAKLKIQIGSSTATDVFSANAQADSTIKLDGLVFKKNGNNEISVITPTAVTSSNRLVTEQDIANLANNAMLYKGSIASDTQWPSNENVKAGYVWIASGNFEHGDGSDVETIESGDLIVFNADNDNSKYTVVQSNITLGTGVGQVAANTEGLTNGNLVVATGTGIKTTGISASVLEEANNTRNLTYNNVTGGISITDNLKIMGRDFNQSINITSNNKSIKIANNGNTGVMVDLVWNTIMEP